MALQAGLAENGSTIDTVTGQLRRRLKLADHLFTVGGHSALEKTFGALAQFHIPVLLKRLSRGRIDFGRFDRPVLHRVNQSGCEGGGARGGGHELAACSRAESVPIRKHRAG